MDNIAVAEISAEERTPETMQLEVSKEPSQQLSLPTMVSSVVGACVLSALILVVVVLGVAFRVRHKRKHCRSRNIKEQGECIRTWL